MIIRIRDKLHAAFKGRPFPSTPRFDCHKADGDTQRIEHQRMASFVDCEFLGIGMGQRDAGDILLHCRKPSQACCFFVSLRDRTLVLRD